MTPRERYEADLKSGVLKPDAAQKKAIQILQRVYEDVIARSSRLKHRWLTFSKKPVQGAYLWGGVGRGKSYLMNLFFESLPIEAKRRQHFNRFMESIHQQLAALQGEKDPLKIVAKNWKAEVEILCFDEFMVEDIADAMILGNLLEAFFAEGICLVATSNCAPKDLYRDGLKRDVFLPAIHLIESFTEVVNVESGIDYREQTEITATRYYTPLAGQETFMQAHFEKARGQEALLPNQFEICDRTIQAVKRTAGVVWFEFEEICKEPRAKADYIALADQYHTVLVSNIPQMDESRDDYCKRFIALVDELYDNNINLIVSAQVPAEALYTGKRNAFAFKRTVSRLA